MPKDPNDFTNQFNTVLQPRDEAKFQQWAKANNKMNDLYDYDLRGFWKSGAGTDERGHGTDRYKKPNHVTFSTESIYHGTPDGQGGVHLGGTWGTHPSGVASTFTPSSWMASDPSRLKNLQQYMQTYEPGTVLNLPQPSPIQTLVGRR